ncbi:MAG: hypothetical protein HY964_00225 [Ignavibacteriales bacterium]|nr:hypothetical protein [Ignavibacteriales bacterium]
MLSITERYVVDQSGNRVSVVLDIADYKKLMQELEELEEIRAYDAAKISGSDVIPFEDAVSQIERNRK